MNGSPEGAKLYPFLTHEQRLEQEARLLDEQNEREVIERLRLEAAKFGRVKNLDLGTYAEEFRSIEDTATAEQLKVCDSLDRSLEQTLEENPIDIFAVTYSEHQGQDLYHMVRYHGMFDRAVIKNGVKNWDEVRNSSVDVLRKPLGYRWLEICIRPYTYDNMSYRYKRFDVEPIFVPISKIAAIVFPNRTV